MTILTSKSLDPACMYLSMKSKIVSQRAAKVGRDRRGDRCWRKTWRKKKELQRSELVYTSTGRVHFILLHPVEQTGVQRKLYYTRPTLNMSIYPLVWTQSKDRLLVLSDKKEDRNEMKDTCDYCRCVVLQTFDSSVHALILVSSIPPTSAGLMLSSSLVSSGKSTCQHTRIHKHKYAHHHQPASQCLRNKHESSEIINEPCEETEQKVIQSLISSIISRFTFSSSFVPC